MSHDLILRDMTTSLWSMLRAVVMLMQLLRWQSACLKSAEFNVQAFYLARTGRPGPVLIDVPKDVQQQLAVPDWDVPMAISGYMQRLPQMPSSGVCH